MVASVPEAVKRIRSADGTSCCTHCPHSIRARGRRRDESLAPSASVPPRPRPGDCGQVEWSRGRTNNRSAHGPPRSTCGCPVRLDVDRERLQVAHVVRDAVGKDAAGLFVQLPRTSEGRRVSVGQRRTSQRCLGHGSLLQGQGSLKNKPRKTRKKDKEEKDNGGAFPQSPVIHSISSLSFFRGFRGFRGLFLVNGVWLVPS